MGEFGEKSLGEKNIHTLITHSFTINANMIYEINFFHTREKYSYTIHSMYFKYTLIKNFKIINIFQIMYELECLSDYYINFFYVNEKLFFIFFKFLCVCVCVRIQRRKSDTHTYIYIYSISKVLNTHFSNNIDFLILTLTFIYNLFNFSTYFFTLYCYVLNDE